MKIVYYTSAYFPMIIEINIKIVLEKKSAFEKKKCTCAPKVLLTSTSDTVRQHYIGITHLVAHCTFRHPHGIDFTRCQIVWVPNPFLVFSLFERRIISDWVHGLHWQAGASIQPTLEGVGGCIKMVDTILPLVEWRFHESLTSHPHTLEIHFIQRLMLLIGLAYFSQTHIKLVRALSFQICVKIDFHLEKCCPIIRTAVTDTTYLPILIVTKI